MDCLFCKIAAHTIPARVAFENERLIAFHDLFPQAPVHILIIPKAHYTTLNDVPAADSALLGEMMSTATHLARELGVDKNGYRVVMNCNPMVARACTTSICTCWPDASWDGRQADTGHGGTAPPEAHCALPPPSHHRHRTPHAPLFPV
jgi:histidine triad (HIT) family protein